MAEAVVKAIAEYIGVPYEPENLEGYYKVQSGDTLWGIARKYGVTVDELKSANNLKDNSLSVGQYLLIPNNENDTQEGEIYVVKSGDTLYGIANKFNLTVDELKKLNNLTSNTLSIGQKLIVSMPAGKATTYTVTKGDTLYGIASKYGVTVDSLKSLNNLSSNTLSIGQVLKIPSTTNDSKLTYTVKKGDSLYSIARTYNTTVDEIKRLNNLVSNTLSIGQTLILPS